LGAVTSRATAQVVRLSCLYALLDKSDVITCDHLESALALWQYCEDSAKYIFDVSTGDKNADKIVTALQGNKDGMTRTQLSKLFQRHLPMSEINRALQMLIETGRAEMKKEETSGRPKEIFILLE